MKNNNPKQFTIKFPIFASELLDKPFDMFGGISSSHMIKSLKIKIDTYNSAGGEIKNSKRNKTFEKHIKNLIYDEVDFNGVNALLLRVTAFNTNFQDGFFEEERKINFSKNAKVGSENNFILVYPNIYGLDPNNYRYQWIFLLYEDPNKESNEIISVAKLVIKKILKIDIKNIKLNTVIDNLKENKITPFVSLKIVTLNYDPDDGYSKFKNYIFQQRIKNIQETEFQDLPVENSIELINDQSIIKKGLYSIKKFFVGKKEFRITQTFEEDKEKVKELVEEIYNSEILISEEDLQYRVFEKEFVIEKFKPILEEYLKNKIED